jgi:carboxyl-terminal processing protease
MKGQRFFLLALVGFVSFLSGGWLLQRGTQQAGNVYQQARLFDDVLGYVADYYVDSVTEAELYDHAIDGLLNELEDPYAQFLRPEDFEDFRESTTGNYGGLGIRIDVRDGWITIIAPIADTPAEAAGLATGDRIVGVNGKSTYDWKSDQAVNALRGEPGTKVTLTIARPGMPEPFDMALARANIHLKAIQLATMLEANVGYVSMLGATISENSPAELAEAIANLRERGATSLILDLRYNPGGLLDEGIDISDLFLDPGEDVVSTRGRARGTTESYRARSEQQWPDLPIVVLVNGGSASASEIIAGALQDHDRALILGTTTFGKGTMQSVFRLGPEQALRLTTGRWYTPSGRTIQKPHGQERVTAVAEVGASDTANVAGDTAAVYMSDAGRRLQGGGGIQPDVIVAPDTLTTPEQVFYRSLGPQLPVYRDVMTSYALELKANGEITDERFQVTDAMVQEIVRRLRERDVKPSQEVLAGGWSAIRLELGYEVQRYVFGRESESLRRLGDDPQVAAAVRLLGRAKTVPELLAIAASETGGSDDSD